MPNQPTGTGKSSRTVVTERNATSVPVPKKGRATYVCAGPTGFRLEVTASGSRTYYLKYRARGGRARSYRIGPAEDLSFKEAKDRAEALRGQVASGRDPFAEEQDARKDEGAPVVTLAEAVNYYLAAHRHGLDGKTAQGYEQTRDALPPSFMRSPAGDLTPTAFRSALKQTTSAPVMQNRHLGRLKAVLRFAHAEQKIDKLPALVGMKRPNVETRRERTLTADEIKALWQAVDAAAVTMPRGGVAFAASVRVMLLCGTRLGETSAATWADIDLDGSMPRAESVPQGQPTWYVPKEHRKGERGQKRPHWIPLPPLAVAVLRDLQRATGDKPTAFHKAGYSARTYMLDKLLAEMAKLGHSERFTYHDLRRTCSTWLGELGCPQEMNDLILGHQRKGTLAHYDHSKRIGERAQWLGRWADKVAGIIGQGQRQAKSVLHVYEARSGLPEITATREPDNGRRYLGAFAPEEAVRRAAALVKGAD